MEKLRYDLIHPIILEELAHVFTVGARKHAPNGWLQQPIAHGDQVAALYRHLVAYLNGEHVAKDDGQSHLASVMWRAGTLRVYDRLGIKVGTLPADLTAIRAYIEKELG